MTDAANVDAAVIHSPDWEPNPTELAFQAVRKFPRRFAILGAFPLTQPQKRTTVDSWRSRPGMLGLRYSFLKEPVRGWLADGTLDWLWAAAERPGVPIRSAPVLALDLRRLRTGTHVLGTDITKMPCSWRQCVTMFTDELPCLSERDKDLVMGQAVCALWGWTSGSRAVT